MTLTSRLTVTFLTTLAVVLIAFSVTFFAISRSYLFGQLDERIDAILNTLIAATEIEPDGLEWDPSKQSIRYSSGLSIPDWVVFEENGQVVDSNTKRAADWQSMIEFVELHDTKWKTITHNDTSWRVQIREYVHPTINSIEPKDKPALKADEKNDVATRRFSRLIYVAAMPREPVNSTLRMMGFLLASVSLLIWCLAIFGSRWICRRALLPVRNMADAAHVMTTDKPGERLPVPEPHDELRDLAMAFNDLLFRYRDALERQRRFTAEASHQLRTPLTAILGQLDVALRRERDPEEYRRVVTSVKSQAERLQNLVEMLLFLARSDAEARLPDLKVVDLARWLPEHLEQTWGTHAERNRLKVIHSTTGPLESAVHPVLLAHAIDNLIDNALKYSPPGSPIRIEVGSQGASPFITVSNDVASLTESDLVHFIDPFYRSSQARLGGIPGTGLGLTVTSRIAVAFGGTLVVSKIENGCSLRMELPRPTK